MAQRRTPAPGIADSRARRGRVDSPGVAYVDQFATGGGHGCRGPRLIGGCLGSVAAAGRMEDVVQTRHRFCLCTRQRRSDGPGPKRLRRLPEGVRGPPGVSLPSAAWALLVLDTNGVGLCDILPWKREAGRSTRASHTLPWPVLMRPVRSCLGRVRDFVARDDHFRTRQHVTWHRPSRAGPRHALRRPWLDWGDAPHRR
jgi:hypothetical protein